MRDHPRRHRRRAARAIHGGGGDAACGRAQVLRLVVLPQALAAMGPLLVNQVVILFQDTSLVYVVALRDFLTAASVVADRDARPVEMYLFVAIVYFVICFAGSRWAGRTVVAR